MSTGPYDGDELVRWAESYGHPEGWVKRAQAANYRAELLQSELDEAHRTCGEFTDLGKIGPVSFRGAPILLQGHGCPHCDNGFWTQADTERRLTYGTVHPCPHCGQLREVTA